MPPKISQSARVIKEEISKKIDELFKAVPLQGTSPLFPPWKIPQAYVTQPLWETNASRYHESNQLQVPWNPPNITTVWYRGVQAQLRRDAWTSQRRVSRMKKIPVRPSFSNDVKSAATFLLRYPVCDVTETPPVPFMPATGYLYSVQWRHRNTASTFYACYWLSLFGTVTSQ